MTLGEDCGGGLKEAGVGWRMSELESLSGVCLVLLVWGKDAVRCDDDWRCDKNMYLRGIE